jgi:hypothetical protein
MNSDVTFERLSGSLGSLLLVWARVEKSVRAEITLTHGSLPKAAHGIAAALDNWESDVTRVQPGTLLGPLLAKTLRRQLQTSLDVRNGLCHGLCAISPANGEKPAELVWEINDSKQSICWEALQMQLGWLSKIVHVFSIISNPQVERLGNRAEDTPDNRAWWRSEFALDIPEA